MLRIDPTALDDHARLAASLQRRQAAVEEAQSKGDAIQEHVARENLMIFSVLFCEEVA
jgi:hypothetical protein